MKSQTYPPSQSSSPGALLFALVILFFAACGASSAADVLMPTIQGGWWQIAGDPDLGAFMNPKQQPVDFAIWQAADGTWQLWSCIRHTKCGGNTRIFHRWEGAKLTDRDWKPMGIVMQADAKFGEAPGGLQAPFVIKPDDRFMMFYGDWEHICAATSADGKNFTRRLTAEGRAGMFGEGTGGNARDPMLLRIGGLWHCYYAAHPNRVGAVYCRTSKDLRTWSASRVVAMSGRTGNGPSSAECPFVVEPRPGEFYLFRTQRYGKVALTSVYRSNDPLDFGVNDDTGHFIGTLPVGAPEIFQHEGQYYIASLLPSIKGFQVAKLAWVPQPAPAARGAIIIGAADLATAGQRADTPTPGKWWLNRGAKDWGAKDGMILMAGQPSQQAHKPDSLWQVIPMFRFVPCRVPELVIAPKVTGWYRIHVGLYGDEIEVWSTPHLFGKISGEAFPEYLQAPRGATNRVAEAYWKAADLTGKTIHILQPPAPMAHKGAGWMGGISHIRLVPMSKQEVTAVKHEIELPPLNQRLFAMLDTVDEIFWNGSAETEEDIHAIIWRHQQAGFGRIYWRCFGTCLDNSLAVPAAAPRWSEQDEKDWKEKNHCAAGWKEYFGLAKRFDPLKVAVEYGRTIGADVHAMVRMTNFNRPPYANFWHDHPEFRAQMLVSKRDPKTGARIPVQPYRRTPYQRVLSFAYPEVRTFYVSFLKQIASTGTKGILLDFLRHPPIAGFEPIVADAFKKKFGKDMEPLDIYKDPQIQEMFSEYLRAFLVELRQAVGNDLEIAVRCRGPEAFGFRGKEFIEAGLVNAIVDAHWYSGNGPRPTIDATVAAVGSKGKAMAGADHFDDVDPKNNWARRKGFLSPESVEALAKAYSGRGVTSFGLYESTLHVWNPDARRAIRAAGWNYDPLKKR